MEDITTLNRTIAAQRNQNFLLALNFFQKGIYYQWNWVTLSFLSLFALFGGFLAFIRALANFCLRDFQTFSLTNSMIKKLYTEITEEYQLSKLETDGDINFADLTHTPDMTEQDE